MVRQSEDVQIPTSLSPYYAPVSPKLFTNLWISLLVLGQTGTSERRAGAAAAKDETEKRLTSIAHPSAALACFMNCAGIAALGWFFVSVASDTHALPLHVTAVAMLMA